jgi:hypothetical protein
MMQNYRMMNDFNQDCINKDIEYYNSVGLKKTQDSKDMVESRLGA